MRCKRYRGLSPASPDDDLVALLPVQIQVRFFLFYFLFYFFYLATVQRNMRRRGGSVPADLWTEGRTAPGAPVSAGLSASWATLVRSTVRACRGGHGGGSQSCSITSFAPNRRRASSPRTEQTRILSLERTLRLLPCPSLSAT